MSCSPFVSMSTSERAIDKTPRLGHGFNDPAPSLCETSSSQIVASEKGHPQMRIKILLATAAAALIVGLMPSPASAQLSAGGTQNTGVTATISGAMGTRVLNSIGAVGMSSTGGSATLTSLPFAVSVVEAARSGTAGWYVTAEMTTPLTEQTTSDVIAKSALTLTPNATMVQTPLTGTDAASGAQSLGSAATIWTNTGQSPLTVYTGTHTNSPTITLAPPNGTVNGVYVGTLTVTLFQ